MGEKPKILGRVGSKMWFEIRTGLKSISRPENIGIPENFENLSHVLESWELVIISLYISEYYCINKVSPKT
jgi:hypothetical protein